MKYVVGTKLEIIVGGDPSFTGIVITPEELKSILSKNKLVTSEDVCVKWVNFAGDINTASTYDSYWLDVCCRVIEGK
jgi:hypothetical protein